MTDKNIKVFFVLFSFFVVFFSLSTDIPTRQRGGFFSDESSYFSITQSLANDLDLQYTREDITRIKELFRTGPAAVYLKKSKDGKLTFAKFFAYPLFAAPFYKMFGVHGFLLFNGIMILLTLLMGYKILNKFHSAGRSFLFTIVFVFATVIPVYIWWMTADLFNFFIVFTGLFFFFYPFKNGKWAYLFLFQGVLARSGPPSADSPAPARPRQISATRSWKASRRPTPRFRRGQFR